MVAKECIVNIGVLPALDGFLFLDTHVVPCYFSATRVER
jgi:hypothetical protein